MWPKITLFGDSITRRSKDVDNGCWGSMIAHEVGSYFDVDARGFEGYNTSWAVELLPRLFPKSYLEKVSIFVVFFGHNDSWESKDPAHVPVEKFKSNMHKIIGYLVENGLEKCKIILITPSWYDSEPWRIFRKESNKPTKGKLYEEAIKYRDGIKEVAQKEGVDVVDFFTESMCYRPFSDLFCDGLHFSRVGAKLLFDNIMPIIRSRLEANYGTPIAQLHHVKPVDQLHELTASTNQDHHLI